MSCAGGLARAVSTVALHHTRSTHAPLTLRSPSSRLSALSPALLQPAHWTGASAWCTSPGPGAPSTPCRCGCPSADCGESQAGRQAGRQAVGC